MEPITIYQLAEYRIGREPEYGEDFAEALLPMLAGCEICHSSLAAWNAYPTQSGYVRCQHCIQDLGWYSAEAANTAIFGD
jgi:hypothetical protein